MPFAVDIPNLYSSGSHALPPVMENLVQDQYDSKKEELLLDLSPISFEINPIRIVLDYLMPLFELGENWDGAGALKPSRKAFINTFRFLIQVPKYYVELLDQDSFTPTPYGTVVIDWFNEKENSNLSIEIGASKIGFFVEKSGEFTSFSEGLKFNDYDVPNEIVAAFKETFSK